MQETVGAKPRPTQKAAWTPRGGGADVPRSMAPAAPVVVEGTALELPAWDPGLRPPTRQDYRPGPWTLRSPHQRGMPCFAHDSLMSRVARHALSRAAGPEMNNMG